MQGINSAQPLRIDFNAISKFERSRLEPAGIQSDREAVFSEYACLRLNIGRALSALQTSRACYESVDVELQKVKGRRALTQKLRRQQIAQAAAMAHNSLACAQLNEEGLALAPRINSEWQRLSEELRRLPPPSPEQVSKALADLPAASIAAMREKFKLTDAEVGAVTASARDLAAELKEPPPIPAVLLDDEWTKATERVAAHHRKAAETYSRLKERLEQASTAGLRPAGQ